MNDYPVTYWIRYQERHRRLSTVFRGIIAIPWYIWLILWAIAFSVVVVLAWFVVVFTARWPAELFNFASSFIRYQARFMAWVGLLTDKLPPWGGKPDDQWGLTLEIRPLARYSRPKTGFRYILMLPLSVLSGGVVYYGFIFTFLAWWAILFTGRLPRWCYQPIADAQAWSQRFNAYQYLLVEAWPPFKGLDPEPARVQVEAPANAGPESPTEPA